MSEPLDDGAGDPGPSSEPAERPSGGFEGRIGSRQRLSRRRKKGWRRRKFFIPLSILGLLLVLSAFDAAYVAVTLARELRSVRAHLQQGATVLESGSLSEAQTQFTVAEIAVERARGALGHPIVGLAAAIPWIGDDVQAVRTLAEASGDAVSGASHLADAAGVVGWDGESLPSLGTGVGMLLRGLEHATPELESAARELDHATALVGSIRTDGLLGPVRDTVESARTTLEGKDHLARSAATLGRFLPGFLGLGEPRRYVVITQNLSDPRGSGGFPGDFATLTVHRGDFSLSDFADIGTLDPVPPIRGMPKDYVDRYEAFGGLTTFHASTYSPDFPTSARALMAMWKAGGHEHVDGVISIDPVFMQHVLKALGPTDSPVWPKPITADNVTTIMSRDTFQTNDSTVSNALQSAIGTALWSAILQRDLPPRPTAHAIGLAARERHLQIYSAVASEESDLEDLRVAGTASLEPRSVAASWFGAVASRVGYYAEKSVDYRITLRDDGSALVSVTTTLDNLAPNKPVSILLGGGEDVPVGTYVAFVSHYLPAGAEYLGGTIEAIPPQPQMELGHPVVMQQLEVPPGGSVTTQLAYRYPKAVNGGIFQLRLVVLPALRPDHVTVEVIPPQGIGIVPLGSLEPHDGTARFEGSPTESIDLLARIG